MGVLPGKEYPAAYDEVFTDLTSVEATTDAAALAKLRDKYSQEAVRYNDDQKEIEDKAREIGSGGRHRKASGGSI